MAESLSGRTAFVTGATGFLGTHLIAALTREGAHVHALRRSPDNALRIATREPIWHPGDVLDASSLRDALDRSRPDVVFNLAAYGTVTAQKDALQTYRVNVEGSWNLWCALAGSSARLVHFGTCGEYGQTRGLVREDHVCRPTWFYPATKNASVVLFGSLARETGREVVTLRPFGPYGPADDPSRVVPHVILSLLRGEDVKVTKGEQLRDYAFVSDHVAAMLLAATRPISSIAPIFNIGSGTPITLRHLIETIADLIASDARKRVQFGAIPYRESEVWEMCCDISAARRELGYEPQVTLEDGIIQTIAWYRARVHE